MSTAKKIRTLNDSKSYTGRKRVRRSFGKIPEVCEMPNLIEVQRNSYEKFLQREVHHAQRLNEGLQELIDVICGLGSPTIWDNSNARLGVGDSNVAADPSQTGLQAASNKTYKAMDATYPQRSDQTAEWRATFGSADANYAWEEYTVVNAASDTGKNLNRKVSSKGTKSSGETWTLSLQITFS